jgi:hypothetical protein
MKACTMYIRILIMWCQELSGGVEFNDLGFNGAAFTFPYWESVEITFIGAQCIQGLGIHYRGSNDHHNTYVDIVPLCVMCCDTYSVALTSSIASKSGGLSYHHYCMSSLTNTSSNMKNKDRSLFVSKNQGLPCHGPPTPPHSTVANFKIEFSHLSRRTRSSLGRY